MSRVEARGITDPEAVLDACLELLSVEVGEQSRGELMAQATEGGAYNWSTPNDAAKSAQRVGVLMALIGASREYQFA